MRVQAQLRPSTDYPAVNGYPSEDSKKIGQPRLSYTVAHDTMCSTPHPLPAPTAARLWDIFTAV